MFFRRFRGITKAMATLLIGAVALSVTVSLGGCRRPAPEEVRISLAKGAFFLPLIIAAKKGYLQDESLIAKLTYSNSTNDALNAVLTGNAEVTALGSGGLLPLIARSPGRVKLIYGQNSTSYTLVVPVLSTIRNIEGLRGKRIGVWPSPTAKVFLHLILDTRVGKDAFEIITLESRFLNQALARGDADALFEPDLAGQQAVSGGQGRYLSRSAMEEFVFKPFFNGGGIMTAEAMRSNPGKAERLRRALDRSIAFIAASPVEARSILARELLVPEEIVRVAPLDTFVRLEDVDRASVGRVADLLRRAGVIEGPVNTKELF